MTFWMRYELPAVSFLRHELIGPRKEKVIWMGNLYVQLCDARGSIRMLTLGHVGAACALCNWHQVVQVAVCVGRRALCSRRTATREVSQSGWNALHGILPMALRNCCFVYNMFSSKTTEQHYNDGRHLLWEEEWIERWFPDTRCLLVVQSWHMSVWSSLSSSSSSLLD